MNWCFIIIHILIHFFLAKSTTTSSPKAPTSVPPIKSPESNTTNVATTTASQTNLKYAQAAGALEGSPTSPNKDKGEFFFSFTNIKPFYSNSFIQ